MVWHSTWPVGTVSVRTNRQTGVDNTNYIKSSMGSDVIGTNTVTTRDHFWDVDPNLDGRHRFIQSPKFMDGSLDGNPVIGTGMDGVTYIRRVNADVGRVEGFYRNSQGIYQYIPSFITGAITIGASFTDIVTLPKNIYGEIFLFRSLATGNNNMQMGIFKSTGSVTDAYSLPIKLVSSTDPKIMLELANGPTDATNLKLRVRTSSASTGNSWDYRITYRAI